MKKTRIALLLALLLFSLTFVTLLGIPAAATGECTVTVRVMNGDALDNDKAGKVTMIKPQEESIVGEKSYTADDGTYFSFYALANTGYTFQGWTLKKDDEVPKTKGSGFYDWTATAGNYTLTVNFTPDEYTLTYLWYNDPGYDGPDYEFQGEYPTKHIYGTPTVLPTPILSDGKQTHTFSGWIVKCGENEKKYEAGEQLGANDFSDNITLEPVWTPKDFDVTRIDGYLKNNEFQPFEGAEPVAGTATFGTIVSGKTFGEDRSYRGYLFHAESDTASTEITVSDNAALNIVRRVYIAKEYTFAVQNADTVGDWAVPAKHVYGEDQYLTVPVRAGYTFTGWSIDRSNDPQDSSIYVLKPQDDGTYLLEGNAFDSFAETGGVISLIAGWQAESYAVQYDADTLYGFDTTGLPDTRQYNKDFTLNAIPLRTGYTFKGWHLQGTDAEDFRLAYTIEAGTKTGDLIFEAFWTPNVYQVLFQSQNGTHSLSKMGTQTVQVTFGQKPAAIEPPVCTGYTFGGYETVDGTLLFLSDGSFNPADGTWNLSESTTLFAKWTKNKYTVQIIVNPGSPVSYQCANITVNGQPYDPYATYEYESELNVVLKVKDEFPGRLVQWNGENIPHTDSYSVTVTVVASNQTFTAVVLAKEAIPECGIDYAKEVLTGLTPGEYRILPGGGTEYTFRFNEDGTFTGTRANPGRVSDFFGTTLLITRVGDGVNKADSDPQSITLAPRQDAPTEQREIVRVNTDEPGVIRLEMNDSDTVYEYAWTTEPVQNEDAISNWQDSPALENLDPDTVYYVYIRAKAKAGVSPHGFLTTLRILTPGETMDAFVILLVLSVIILLQVMAILVLILRRRANRNAVVRYSFAYPLLSAALPAMLKGDRIAVLVLASIVVVLQIVLTILLLRTFVFKPRWIQPEVYVRQPDGEPEQTKPENPDDAEQATPAATEEGSEPDETAGAQSVFAMEQEEEPADGWYGNGEFVEPAPNPIFLYPEDGESDEVPKGEVPPEE